MRHLSRIVLALLLVVLFFAARGTAQWDYLDVPQGFETLNLAIEGDTTATGDPKSLNRVYRLQRGGMYLLNGRVSNIKGTPLRIWAADGGCECDRGRGNGHGPVDLSDERLSA